VFENKVLRRIFDPKRDGVTREWRKLHNEELYDPYSSPSVVRVIKSRRMRGTGHVARMGERRGIYTSVESLSTVCTIRSVAGKIFPLLIREIFMFVLCLL
jgi:hypothetical protein